MQIVNEIAHEAHDTELGGVALNFAQLHEELVFVWQQVYAFLLNYILFVQFGLENRLG